MASEPDDYQTISDNCPGYMVLVSEGIICTRCAGEKRHKAGNCPKYSTAVDVATDGGSVADSDGMDVDSGMESLSDTSSVSSESSGRSDGSEMQETVALRSGRGGNHSQDARPRRGFARLDTRHASIQPDRTSPSPPNRQVRPGLTQSKVNAHIPGTATSKHELQSRNGGDIMSPITTSRILPSSKEDSSIKHSNDKRKGSHSHSGSSHRTKINEPHGDRLPSKSLADTLRKFEYSNTTCPSSFGFGRLPSEAMG